MNEVIVKSYFMEYGTASPANSEFKGLMNQDSLFGGFFEYTARKDAVKNSMDTSSEEFNNVDDDFDDSVKTKNDNYEGDTEFWNINGTFVGYTSRSKATEKSMKSGEYFTMSNLGKLTSVEDRKNWVKQSRNYFSKDGDIAWALVVSLKSYDLLDKYGIEDQNDFARITQQCLQSSLRKMKLDPTNFVWWEDYHTNTDNPHIHITFIEKDKTRTRGKFTERELNTIKRSFVSTIAARAIYREKYKTDSVDVLKAITEDRQSIVTETKKFGYETVSKIANLYSQLPKSGRLQYNSIHMKPYREQLDEIVDDLLHTEEIKPLYEEFMSKMKTLDDVMNDAIGGEINNMRQTQDQKLRVQIANSVLSEFKNIRNKLPENMRLDRVNGETSNKVIGTILDELAGDSLSSDEKDICKLINIGKYDAAKELLGQIDSKGNREFLSSAIEFLTAKDEDDKLSAIDKFSNDTSSKYSRHFMNYFRRGTVLNKQSYPRLRNVMRGGLLSSAKRSVRAGVRELSDEIDAFISNSSHIANGQGYQRAAESLAKETEREKEQEDYYRDA